MRRILAPTEKYYQTLGFRKNYSKYILENFVSCNNEQEFLTHWNTSVGQFRVLSIWPLNDKNIVSIDLETLHKKNLTHDELYEKIKESFSNQGHEISNVLNDPHIMFDYTPDKNGGGKMETSIFLCLIGDVLRMKIWHNPEYGLQRFLEISDLLGLETRPFSKTPRPFIVEEIIPSYYNFPM
ncbi:MAG: hypothetical protein AABX88_02370 [Nanoarchaeota archaeon]